MNDYLKERDLWWPVSPKLMASYRDGSHTEVWQDGTLLWIKNRVSHRDGDKPARIWSHGTLIWYKNGLLHRDGDKPAQICEDGTLEWYKNDKLHRVTGPAVIRPDNKLGYWINGVNVTKEVKSWLKSRKYKAPFTPEQQVEFLLTFS
jgi:Ni,Fe-hydrogenase I large subunit